MRCRWSSPRDPVHEDVGIRYNPTIGRAEKVEDIVDVGASPNSSWPSPPSLPRYCDASTTPKRKAPGLLGRSQRLSPQAQDIQGRVVVTIQRQATTRAMIDPIRQRQVLPVSALATVLRGIRRIDGRILPTSVCCFVRQKGGQLAPGGIQNTLGETVVMHHLVDGQVFNGNEPVLI